MTPKRLGLVSDMTRYNIRPRDKKTFKVGPFVPEVSGCGLKPLDCEGINVDVSNNLGSNVNLRRGY